jgi:hypothetical protein
MEIIMSDEECPGVEAKYGFIGELALDIAGFIFSIFVTIKVMFDPFYEPELAIKVCGEVNPE